MRRCHSLGSRVGDREYRGARARKQRDAVTILIPHGAHSKLVEGALDLRVARRDHRFEIVMREACDAYPRRERLEIQARGATWDGLVRVEPPVRVRR